MSLRGFPHVTIAVVGADGVGKTAFITSALNLKPPVLSRSSKKKMSLDGTVYLVRLSEIPLHQVSVDDASRIVWPRSGADSAAPTIDGVIVVYDTTQPANFAETTRLLGLSYRGRPLSWCRGC